MSNGTHDHQHGAKTLPGESALRIVGDTEKLIATARSWLEHDPDPETRDELTELVDQASAGSASAMAEIKQRFATRLEFGTAGMRGSLGAGTNRMNRVVVAQAAIGVSRWLTESHGTPRTQVIIGFDGRKNSAIFAKDTAELLAGSGIHAVLLPHCAPTPVLAFAVRYLEADAGIMITASHNPAGDNGFKLYLGNADAGSQIVSPTDAQITAHIVDAALEPISTYPRSTQYEVASDDVESAYVAATAGVATTRHDRTRVTFCYTALHGVGWHTAEATFRRAGFSRPVVVAEQRDPDPRFPTVTYPNPEEAGTLDRAFATAQRTNVDVVIAHDPDADRLALGIKDPASSSGYRQLTGNEVGGLLGWRAAELASRSVAARREPATLACSIVSSPALAAVADHYNLRFVQTLPGFKWLSRQPGLIFGYEEALGYLVNPETVRDKDGISAAVAILDLANELAGQGRTLADRLDEFANLFGVFVSTQLSVRVSELSRIDAIMSRLRSAPPGQLGGCTVERVEDFEHGWGDLSPTNMVRIVLSHGSRVMVRPSGTEPKLKIYVDVTCSEGTVSQRYTHAHAQASALSEALREFSEPETRR